MTHACDRVVDGYTQRQMGEKRRKREEEKKKARRQKGSFKKEVRCGEGRERTSIRHGRVE